MMTKTQPLRDWRPRPHRCQKFKKKDNKKQFEVDTQVLDHIETTSSLLKSTPPQVEKALEELIADSAGSCWEVVREYESKSVADDNDKRLRRSEVRGSPKRRRSQSQEKA